MTACILGALVTVLAAPAGAQDPYGGTTSSTGRPRLATIELTVEVGPEGIDVGVRACGYEGDAAGGRVTFNGETVLSGLVAGPDGCLVLGGGAGRSALLAVGQRLRAQDGAPIAFRVPPVPPGDYLVCAVVAGYNTPCEGFTVIASASSPDADRGGGGSLPRTGMYVLLLLAIALLLLLVGRALLEESRRRRDADRDARRAATHLRHRDRRHAPAPK